MNNVGVAAVVNNHCVPVVNNHPFAATAANHHIIVNNAYAPVANHYVIAAVNNTDTAGI